MAVDTEVKRWGMMQWASGPAYYPTLFNPDTSGLAAIERATVLKLYGGIAWGEAVEPEPEAPTAPDGGGRGAKQYAKRKYPRKVVIDGRAYTVQSAAEERELLRAYRDRLEADALRLALEEAPKRAVAQAKVRVIRAQRRLDEVDDREDAWMRRLRDEDEELLIILH